ncbi:MAG: hypothetical protein LBL59_01840 [Xanthomonadaceae bacterium]|nr:hypothetical protein [Xanthomonadaceae bacterium]
MSRDEDCSPVSAEIMPSSHCLLDLSAVPNIGADPDARMIMSPFEVIHPATIDAPKGLTEQPSFAALLRYIQTFFRDV